MIPDFGGLISTCDSAPLLQRCRRIVHTATVESPADQHVGGRVQPRLRGESGSGVPGVNKPLSIAYGTGEKSRAGRQARGDALQTRSRSNAISQSRFCWRIWYSRNRCRPK
jgi:hypothetical protein